MKMAAEVRWLITFIAFAILSTLNANTVHRKFQYKYSFKPPYLAQRDNSVPFWEYGGNTIASSENVRVAPSLHSQKGAIWTKKPIDFDWWEVDIVFRLSGRGRVGADGLAFWYTAEKGAYDGTVFGSSDKWQGLGVFFDSFDNDNKRNNPYIMAVLNDGTKIFDHANDGATQLLAGCQKDFRNKPFPTRARIEYYQNTTTLLFHNGLTNNDKDYEICFRVENVVLPKNGYFGVSAATGGLADDHDVLQFLTTSLHPVNQMTIDQHINTDEQASIAQEYQVFQNKLDQQMKQHEIENPDMKDWFETDSQRELRQIFSGQMKISDVLHDLHRKLDEVIGRQERTLSLVSQVQASGVPMGGGYQGQPIDLVDTSKKHELSDVVNNQQIILNTARELKSFIGEVNSKAETILHNQARAPTAQVQPMGYDYQSLISEMRDGLNQIKRDMSLTNSKLQGNGSPTSCPTANCLSTTIFILFFIIQIIILIGYNIYRDNKEAQAKKFY